MAWPLQRSRLTLSAAATACLALPALAQPDTFTEAGLLSAPLDPPSVVAGVAFSVSGRTGPEQLAVRWYRLQLIDEIVAPRFFQITATPTSAFAAPASVSLALYNASGERVATDFGTAGVSSGLSFGSSLPGPRSGEETFGRDGNLAPGEYWLALAAGGTTNVSAGANDWNVSTNTSLTLDLNNPFTAYVCTVSLSLGNTDPRTTTPPANDDCANARPIETDEFFIGTIELATNDGNVECFQPLPTTVLRDIWFRYTPQTNGRATAESFVQDASVAVLPQLARYNSCGQAAVQCGTIFVGSDLVPGYRLEFDVIAGETYLIGLSGAQGSTGPVNLRVTLESAAGCDSIDFNADGLFPSDQDLIDFLAVLAGGDCSTGTCNDIDFNNNGLFPEDGDLIDFLGALAGSGC